MKEFLKIVFQCIYLMCLLFILMIVGIIACIKSAIEKMIAAINRTISKINKLFDIDFDTSKEDEVFNKLDVLTNKVVNRIKIKEKQIEYLKSCISEMSTASETMRIFSEFEKIEKRGE